MIPKIATPQVIERVRELLMDPTLTNRAIAQMVSEEHGVRLNDRYVSYLCSAAIREGFPVPLRKRAPPRKRSTSPKVATMFVTLQIPRRAYNYFRAGGVFDARIRMSRVLTEIAKDDLWNAIMGDVANGP